MIRLAICDDDKFILDDVEKFLGELNIAGLNYKIYHSAEQLFYDTLQYDIFLLDIEMQNMSGLELARKIREKDPYAVIIFMTSHSNYVFDVFDSNAFDFMTKPLTYEKFSNTLQRVVRYLFESKNNFVFVSDKQKFSVPCQKITYIEKNMRKADIHTDEGIVYGSYLVIQEAIKQLPENMFAMINKGCIVNLSKIVELSKDKIILSNNETLYMARGFKKSVKEKHLKYLDECI